mgnify:FL=1
MKILITGGSGLLGSNLIKILSTNHEILAPAHKYLDITDYNSLFLTIYDFKPDLIIHCAAIAKFSVAENKYS